MHSFFVGIFALKWVMIPTIWLYVSISMMWRCWCCGSTETRIDIYYSKYLYSFFNFICFFIFCSKNEFFDNIVVPDASLLHRLYYQITETDAIKQSGYFMDSSWHSMKNCIRSENEKQIINPYKNNMQSCGWGCEQ